MCDGNTSPLNITLTGKIKPKSPIRAKSLCKINWYKEEKKKEMTATSCYPIIDKLHYNILDKKTIIIDLVPYIGQYIKKCMKQEIMLEELGHDKEVGNMCLFCLKSTGGNIPVCLNCILSENFYHSLGVLKQMLGDKKTQT